ncbi:hypothetical protein [Anabaena sp. CCY 0017]|uniref:hypothetical protein n=1 Tax=Anabaena sp. CCY 0017 TaxID=3103866 RepID=UPI0039C64E69
MSQAQPGTEKINIRRMLKTPPETATKLCVFYLRHCMKVNNILEDALITLTREQLSRSVLEVCQSLSLASRDTSSISTS